MIILLFHKAKEDGFRASDIGGEINGQVNKNTGEANLAHVTSTPLCMDSEHDKTSRLATRGGRSIEVHREWL